MRGAFALALALPLAGCGGSNDLNEADLAKAATQLERQTDVTVNKTVNEISTEEAAASETAKAKTAPAKSAKKGE